MPQNFYMYFVAALIPMIMGFIYYHPKVMGSAWMKANKFTPADLEGGNMTVIMIVSYLLSVLLSFSLGFVVIHQTHIFSMLMPEVQVSGSETQQLFNNLMAEHGNNFRTFKHGALHGAILGIFTILPVLGTNALFEKKGWNYILVNCLYWLLCLALMGGLLCATLRWAPLS